MTKVILSFDLLEYREAMAELVDEVLEGNTSRGTRAQNRREEQFPVRNALPAFRMAGLLRSPQIEELYSDISLADGQLEGIVLITASGEYGVMSVYVVLEDAYGEEIESGFAMQAEKGDDDWGYIPSAYLPSGTSVTVRAIAMDPLGGIGIQEKSSTL